MLVAVAAIALSLPVGVSRGSALPVRTPPPYTSASASQAPFSSAANVLPVDSSLIFVLDEPISSSSTKTGQLIDVHLAHALVVAGHTLARAGTPATIRILSASPAQAGDEYGYVDIYFMPLRLSDGALLPLRAPTSHLTVHTTAGHESTVATEDTVADIVFPLHVLYQVFRKGRNVTLAAGTRIRARTVATLVVGAQGAVAIETPSPLGAPAATPASDFAAMPFATAPNLRPNQKPTPYVVPSETPYVVPSPTPYGASPPPSSPPNAGPTPTPYVVPSPTPYVVPSPTPYHSPSH